MGDLGIIGPLSGAAATEMCFLRHQHKFTKLDHVRSDNVSWSTNEKAFSRLVGFTIPLVSIASSLAL